MLCGQGSVHRPTNPIAFISQVSVKPKFRVSFLHVLCVSKDNHFTYHFAGAPVCSLKGVV